MKKREKLSLIFNILILLMEVIGATMPLEEGIERLEFYTVLSNYFTIIPCLLMVIFIIVKKSLSEIPYPVMIMKYMATVALALTFIVVLVVIIPSDYGFSGYLEGLLKFEFEGEFLYWHLLCPLLTVISFIFFEGDRRLNKKKTMYYPCLYTLVYAFVLVILNITGKVAGPYPFLMVLVNPWYISLIWFVVIGLVNYFLAREILLVNQIRAPRIKLKH